jgi:3-oxoacyl-[acyl-carrier protein] reductase
MEALAMTLAKEERPNGIRVNVVRPGLVETDMGVKLAKATMGIKDIQELYPLSPFGRVGIPSDIGNTVAFLVSEAGEYITGATIKVSGGA